MQNSMKITLSFNVKITCELICMYYYSLIYLKIQIFINYEKIILKFVVLFAALGRSGSILPVEREITRIKLV